MSKFILYVLLFCIVSCKSQTGYVYKKVPKNYEHLYLATPADRSEILRTLKSPFLISSVLPKNFDKSGKTDYTAIIQNAILQNRTVIFPKGNFFINKKGLTIPSNTTIYFEENSVLHFEKNNLIRYEILRVHDAENIKIYFANIIGDRDSHLGSEGEWGFGISIQDSKNVYLYKCIVKDCWGDGIFIGSEGKILSRDIIVKGGWVDNNRRNGISVTSAVNLSISDIVASNSNGTFPMAGIDLEPSHNWEFMENVSLNNIVTYNNGEDGLLIVLVRLKAPKSKYVSINLFKHIDLYSKYGLALLLDDNEIIGKLPTGKILLNDVRYSNNQAGKIRNYSPTSSNEVKIIIDALNFSDINSEVFKSSVKPNNLTIINSAK